VSCFFLNTVEYLNSMRMSTSFGYVAHKIPIVVVVVTDIPWTVYPHLHTIWYFALIILYLLSPTLYKLYSKQFPSYTFFINTRNFYCFMSLYYGGINKS
jgi:hypothetical protein